MGGINTLNPLQTVVPACGQVQFCGLGDGSKASFSTRINSDHSVGGVLLVVRYGKYRMRALDELSHRSGVRRHLYGSSPWGSSTPLHSLIPPLTGIRVQVFEARHFVLRGLTKTVRLHREGWIDTEVESK